MPLLSSFIISFLCNLLRMQPLLVFRLVREWGKPCLFSPIASHLLLSLLAFYLDLIFAHARSSSRTMRGYSINSPM